MVFINGITIQQLQLSFINSLTKNSYQLNIQVKMFQKQVFNYFYLRKFLICKLLNNYNKKLRPMKEKESNQLNQDIVILLKIFKRTLNSFQALCAPQEESAQKAMLIHKIYQQNKYLLQMQRKYRQIDYYSNLQTFQKMRLKLKELLSLMKVRWHLGSAYRDIRLFLQQIEVNLTIFDKNMDFSLFMAKIYSTIKEHIRNFKIRLDLFSNHLDYSKEKQQKKIKRSFSTCVAISNTISNNDYNTSSLSSLFCLQLDNAHLKTLFYNLQKNQIDALEMQLERNKIIAKQIENFSKLFYLKFNNSKRYYRAQLTQKSKLYQNIRIKTMNNQKLMHNFSINRGKRMQFKQNQQQASKVLFKINNVYVSGNEFDVFCQKNKKKAQKWAEGKKKGSLFLNRAFLNPLTSKFNNSDSKELLNF